MIADPESLTKAIDGAGFHEPLQFDWRVTGYFRTDLLEGHIQKIAQGTHKYLCENRWPPKDLQYDLSKVDPVPLYSREQVKEFSSYKGTVFAALKVC